jgi:hypothetical protein
MRSHGIRLLASAALAAVLALCPGGSAAQDEFLLNDDRIDRDQWAPRVARASGGALVVVWMDGRNGTETFVDFDVYAMTIRDPDAVGTTINRRLNDDGPGAIQGYPAIAASPGGTLYCAWEDSRPGNRDIYGCALDSLGVRLTPNLRVSDDPGATNQSGPQVTAVGSSGYLVVWGDARDGQGEVFGSYRTVSGAPIGSNVRISADPVPDGSYQGEPAAASNAAGLTLVAWLDGREGGVVFGATFDVYGQWLDAAGSPIGGNFKINDTVGAQRNTSVCVAADPASGFVVGWIDRRNGPGDPGDVYAQRFDASGMAVGGNVRVNDDPAGRDQRAVRAFPAPGASYLIWEDLRGSLGLDSNVELARVPYDASPPGPNFRANVLTPARQGTPSGVWDGVGAILASWEDARHGGQRPSDIYALPVTGAGMPLGTETQLNDDAAPNSQRRAAVGKGAGGQYLATWIDLRGGGHNLYCQALTSIGARDGPNYLLWRDDGVSRAIQGSAAVSPSGPGLVAAFVTRSSDAGEIRGFLFPEPGAAASGSFWISDSLPSAQSTQVGAATSAGFAVAWLDSRDGGPRIYAQRLGLDGARAGPNRPALAVEPLDPPYALDLDADPGGGYWLCYAEGIASDQRLWLTHLGADLAADRLPIPIAPLRGGARSSPVIGVGPDRRVEMAWLGTSPTGYGGVCYQGFDSLGTPLGPVLDLGPPIVSGPEESPAIAVAGARSVVGWSGKQDGDWSAFLQGFEGGAAPFTGVIRVDQDVLAADQIDVSCGLDASGNAVVIWTDSRSTSSSTDIVGRTLTFAPTEVLEFPEPEPTPEPLPPSPPGGLRVAARPNPFSGSVAIAVEAPEGARERVVVRVFNLRGQLVETLHDGRLAASGRVLRWIESRPSALSSGVYWIVVEGGGERRALRVVHLR